VNVEISIPEVIELVNEIYLAPEKLFEMMRLDLRKAAAADLSALLDQELTIHLGRERYERCKITVNHRNGS